MKTGFTIECLKKSKCAHLNAHILNTPNSVELKKKSKYNNKKCVVDEIEFDSIKEAKRYKELKILRKVGAIAFLELQVEYKLEINGEKIGSYFADFVYRESSTGILVVEDVKSAFTRKLPVYRLKKKLMKACWDIDINEV